MTTGPIIRFENVSLAFGKHTIHRNLNFEVPAGQGIVILGPSGIGKTMILKLIIGLIRPTSGKIFINDREIGSAPEDERHLIRAHIGMLFQGAALFDSLTVYENIAFSLRERGENDEEKIRSIVTECLEVIGLPEVSEKFPPQLSGGQKKRVGLARALASSPSIMLFDEPTTGLDPTATRMIDELIVRLREKMHMTCISVTHDIESAKRIADRWILLNATGIIADGGVSEVISSNPYIKSFVTGNWDDAMTGLSV